MGDGHHDSVAMVPDGVERSIRTVHAVKTFQRAVVIARQAGDAAQLDGLGPGFAAVGGAREYKIAGAERELRPSDIKIAGMRACGVGDHPRLILKRNSWRGLMPDHRDCVRLPGLAAIERAADENSVAGCALGPIVVRAELVKRDVA